MPAARSTRCSSWARRRASPPRSGEFARASRVRARCVPLRARAGLYALGERSDASSSRLHELAACVRDRDRVTPPASLRKLGDPESDHPTTRAAKWPRRRARARLFVQRCYEPVSAGRMALTGPPRASGRRCSAVALRLEGSGSPCGAASEPHERTWKCEGGIWVATQELRAAPRTWSGPAMKGLGALTSTARTAHKTLPGSWLGEPRADVCAPEYSCEVSQLASGALPSTARGATHSHRESQDLSARSRAPMCGLPGPTRHASRTSPRCACRRRS